MNSYHIALFIHIVTLIVAASATAVTKLAAGRRARAGTIGQVLEWHHVLTSSSKVFPICLASFVITGLYMLSRTQIAVWSTPFAVAGIVGSALLLASGAYLGVKGKALGEVLNRMAAANGPDQPAPKMVPPALLVALPLINTGISLGVVFDMVMKPASISMALGVIALGIALGAAKGLLARRAASQQAVTRSAPDKNILAAGLTTSAS